MAWKKAGRAAVLGFAGALFMGSILLASAENIGNMTSSGDIKFKAGDGETVDPENPDEPDPTPVDPEPDPGPGPSKDGLNLVMVPTLDFGEVEISNKDKQYFAKGQYITNKETGEGSFCSNYVQVTDLRGNNAGWRVTVTQNGQFENKQADAVNKQLTGAEVLFKQGNVNTTTSGADRSLVSSYGSEEALVPGEASEVMKAEKKGGSGSWYALFGETENLVDKDADGQEVTETLKNGQVKMKFNPNILLDIPGSTAKDAALYQTTLTWTLYNTPD